MEKPTPELPILRLGLLGFNAAQQALFETALVVLRTRQRWSVVPLEQADAICVNGSRTTTLPDGSLEIAGGSPGAGPLRLEPGDSERPLAFTLPLAPGVHAGSTFDMASPASTRAMLEKFEGWLRPLAVQFCLASRIVKERIDVASTVYHVSVDGRLVAIVSRRSGVGVLPIADPFRIHDASWAKRPGPADELPGHFVHLGLSQVLWQYAMRTTRNLLPTYFRSTPIYWCRAPQLPPRLLNDAHLLLVRELSQGPATFAELQQRTGIDDATLSRDLAGLRIVGAVTHDRKQALRVAMQPGGRGLRNAASRPPAPAASRARRGSSVPADSAMDKTAPAPLAPQDH